MSRQFLSARLSRVFIFSRLSRYKSFKTANSSFCVKNHKLLNLKSLTNQIISSSVSFTSVNGTTATNMAETPQNVDYEGLLHAQKDDSVLIIDVREQKEIDETGKLPGSIHIPMGNVSNVLEALADDEFKKQYEKPKPKKDTKIILSCRAGMRSAKVQGELQKLGYHNAWNYVGGWGEWESKHKS